MSNYKEMLIEKDQNDGFPTQMVTYIGAQWDSQYGPRIERKNRINDPEGDPNVLET